MADVKWPFGAWLDGKVERFDAGRRNVICG